MSSRQQSRNAAFARRMKSKRKLGAIFRDNRDKPGFIGGVLNIRISAPGGEIRSLGAGAMFFTRT